MNAFNVTISLLIIAMVLTYEIQDKDTSKGYMKRYLWRVSTLVLLALMVLSYILIP